MFYSNGSAMWLECMAPFGGLFIALANSFFLQPLFWEQRDKGTKGQRDKGTKGQRDRGTKGQKKQRDNTGTKEQSDNKRKRGQHRNKETKAQRNKGSWELGNLGTWKLAIKKFFQTKFLYANPKLVLKFAGRKSPASNGARSGTIRPDSRLRVFIGMD